MDQYITRFEYVRIIGQRAKQISEGAPINIDIYDTKIFPNGVEDFLEIAEEELRQKKCPLNVHRKMPTGKTLVISVNELEIM